MLERPYEWIPDVIFDALKDRLGTKAWFIGLAIWLCLKKLWFKAGNRPFTEKIGVIAGHARMSYPTAEKYLNLLEDKGFIRIVRKPRIKGANEEQEPSIYTLLSLRQNAVVSVRRNGLVSVRRNATHQVPPHTRRSDNISTDQKDRQGQTGSLDGVDEWILKKEIREARAKLRRRRKTGRVIQTSSVAGTPQKT
jgi:hypothetical protein